MRPSALRTTYGTPPARHAGAVLVIGLILLAIVTLVATAGMRTATVELRMAAGKQAASGAFQAAENAIETAMHCRPPAAGKVVTANDCPAAATAQNERYDFTLQRDAPAEDAPLPEGMSLGTELAAIHFTVTAEAAGSRGASAQVTQGFYVMGLKD